VSADLLIKLSYCLLAVGIAGLVAAVVLYRKLELSRAWHILFAVPLPQTASKRIPKPKAAPQIVEPKTPETFAMTKRLGSEDTIVLYEETMIHTTEVI